MKRRDFIKGSMAGAAILAMPYGVKAAEKTENKKKGKNSTLKDAPQEEPFHLGMAGYTFVKFKIDETLAFMKRLDVHYLCIKDFHLPLDSNAEEIAAFHAKLAQYDLLFHLHCLYKIQHKVL